MSNALEVYYYGKGFVDGTTQEILKEELLIGFAFSIKKCKQVGCREITIYIPTFQNLETNILQLTLGNLARELQKKKQARIEGVLLKVSTPHRRFPHERINSTIVLAIYPTQNMLDRLKIQAPNLTTLIIVPYVLSELEEWLQEHDAKPIPLKR